MLAYFLAFGCANQWVALDADGDGWTVGAGDCWDEPALHGELEGSEIHPEAPDVPYDGVDADCAGDDDFDHDGDGYVSSVWVDAETEGTPTVLPGGDCWDDRNEIEQEFGALPGFEQLDAAEVHPGAEETWYDGIDADCDGGDDFDQDGDGHASAIHRDGKSAVGDDCFDAIGDPFENAAGLVPGDVNPSAKDACYDATDADCDGASDWDCDGDGFLVDVDCDDTDPTASPGGNEIWYDGVDQDCDGNDADKDHDGYAKDDYEGDVVAPGTEGGDCWDNPAEPWPPLNGLAALTPPMVHPGVAIDVFYDGIDADCDGSERFDRGRRIATERMGSRPRRHGRLRRHARRRCTRRPTRRAPLRTTTTATTTPTTSVPTSATTTSTTGTATATASVEALRSARAGTRCGAHRTRSTAYDTDATIYTGAPEIVDNGIDENCDGNETCYADADGDSYRPDSGTVLSLADMDCTDPGEAETSTPPDDCDDEEFLVNPGASEVCDNGIDDNCNDTADTCPSTGEIGVETAAHTVIRGALADTELGAEPRDRRCRRGRNARCDLLRTAERHGVPVPRAVDDERGHRRGVDHRGGRGGRTVRRVVRDRSGSRRRRRGRPGDRISSGRWGGPCVRLLRSGAGNARCWGRRHHARRRHRRPPRCRARRR